MPLIESVGGSPAPPLYQLLAHSARDDDGGGASPRSLQFYSEQKLTFFLDVKMSSAGSTVFELSKFDAAGSAR